MGCEGRKFIDNLNADVFGLDKALRKITKAPLNARVPA
jgi:hypothetical protein